MKIINHTEHCRGILSFTTLCVLTLYQSESHQPCFIGVNLKSGKYFLSLLLLAVFLNCPSDLEVSYCFQRVKVQRRRILCLFDTLLHLELATLVTLFVSILYNCLRMSQSTCHARKSHKSYLQDVTESIAIFSPQLHLLAKGYNDFSFEVHSFDHHFSCLFDWYFVLFTNWKQIMTLAPNR